MSSYLNKGRRMKVRETKKEVKHRTKDFYAILHELERVATILKADEELTEDNLVDKAQALTAREIASMEKFVLMGKLGMYQNIEKEIPNDKNNI